MHTYTVMKEKVQSLQTERNKYVFKRDIYDDSDRAHMTSFLIEFKTEEKKIKFSSSLTDSTHYVSLSRLSNHCAVFSSEHSGVPQSSFLDPILWSMYIKPLSTIVHSQSITHHSLPDDLQLQMSARPVEISELLHSMLSPCCFLWFIVAVYLFHLSFCCLFILSLTLLI